MAEIEYIPRETATEQIKKEWEKLPLSETTGFAIMMRVLTKIPAADVVPVVRCKDCICFHPTGTSKHNGDCDKHYERVQCDDFCSWAEVEQDG